MEITVSGIYKKYRNKTVLMDASFYAKSGEIVGILGRNGCGKTTLLSILAGNEKADMGSVTFSEGGQNLSGYLPQINPIIEEVSVRDNLGLWIDDSNRIDEVLRSFDFYDIRGVKAVKLSGGMKRRLAIMCAMCNSPKLLIMDEPTAALDIVYKRLIHEMMRDFADKGGTIILVTHEKEEIEMCDRCYLLENGALKLN